MSDTYTIKTMSAGDVKTAIDWAGREGWNPGLNDAELFYTADNSGFFKVVLNGQIIATGSAVIYDDAYAFCGLYIVDPNYRGKGYGLALTKARLGYCGARNVGIDGVLENVKIYERIGYVPYYENCRYSGVAVRRGAIAKEIMPITSIDFDGISTYDRQCFPAQRDAFLKAWLSQPVGTAIAFVKNGLMKGYGVRRKCLEGYKIGPLFADNQDIAENILDALTADIEEETFYLDTPENNADAIAVAEKRRMEKVFATARMYQKGLPDIAEEKIFGITTFELG